MTATTDRTWDLPKQPWIMGMTWSELLFAHWPVDPSVLAPLLPQGLSLDIREDKAWIGVVPFLMSDVAPRCCPSIPKLSRFLELNVRTYVTYAGKPGVWFFSLDAASRIAVRCCTSHIQSAIYGRSHVNSTKTIQEVSPTGVNETIEVSGQQRLTPAIERSVKPPMLCQARSKHWLTALIASTSADRQGRLYRGEIDHAPWSLSPASCEERQNTMCTPLGIDLVGRPHLLFAQPIKVHVWMVCCDQ
ncbi:MAG: DUF2071 domain-containing protein [Pirellulaceae bacterium]